MLNVPFILPLLPAKRTPSQRMARYTARKRAGFSVTGKTFGGVGT